VEKIDFPTIFIICSFTAQLDAIIFHVLIVNKSLWNLTLQRNLVFPPFLVSRKRVNILLDCFVALLPTNDTLSLEKIPT